MEAWSMVIAWFVMLVFVMHESITSLFARGLLLLAVALIDGSHGNQKSADFARDIIFV